VNLKVSPDLEKIVAAAKEANISIHDLQFVRSLDTDVLEALSIVIEGNDEAKGYFSWLLAKSNLRTEPVG
jgi:hypothetical protein